MPAPRETQLSEAGAVVQWYHHAGVRVLWNVVFVVGAVAT